MVASKQVGIPLYRGSRRQRGRGFGALAQGIGTTAIPFLSEYIVPAAKRVGEVLTCWNLLRQKLQRFLVVEGISRQLQRLWEDRLRENSWVVVKGK